MAEHAPVRTIERSGDVAVLGRSAETIAAAVRLAQRGRTVLVVDEPLREGTEAPDDGLDEARRHGVERLVGRVVGSHLDDEGRHRIELPDGHAVVARRVLDAAGDVGPAVGDRLADELDDEDRRHEVFASGDRTDWEQRYAGDKVWSANPNGTLVAEVEGLTPGRALDVGAGEGADAIWLAERGWTVTATDISANALARVAAEAERRGVAVELRHGDANDPDAFEAGAHDLVSLQYGSFRRRSDGRGLHNLLGAVAPGGVLLVVSHDLAPAHHGDDATRMFDPLAYVGVDEIAAALRADPDWTIEVHETRPRPAGAASTHHVDDVVLRARRADRSSVRAGHEPLR